MIKIKKKLKSHRDFYFSLGLLSCNVWFFFCLSTQVHIYVFHVPFIAYHQWWVFSKCVWMVYATVKVSCAPDILMLIDIKIFSLLLCFKHNWKCINFRDSRVLRKWVTHQRAEVWGNKWSSNKGRKGGI